MRRLLPLLVVLACGPGCLVLNVNPLYDEDSLSWEPELIGSWQALDDKVSLQIAEDEWKSYEIRYVHPTESGRLTGYLTIVGEHRYLDVMPVRGEERGALLVPVHAFVQVRLEGNRLHLTPLSYDWLAGRIMAGELPDGLDATLDQKDNALLLAPTARLRAWLRRQATGTPVFGVTTTFLRVRTVPPAVP